MIGKNSKLDGGYAVFIALFSCFALVVSNGMILTGLSVYDKVFVDTFGWSMGEIKFRDLITLMLTGLFAPFVGIIIDKFGVRVCMLAGWVMLALGAFLYSRVNSLTDMYIIHALYSIVIALTGLNVAVILVSSWFVKHRGTAIGVALVGTSLGGILLPQYLTRMNLAFDWRYAFMFAIIFPAVMFVVTLLLVRNKPTHDSHTAVQENNKEVVELDGITYQQAIRTKTFWAIALIAMLTFYSILGFQSSIFFYTRTAGFDATVATNALSSFFFAALIGKFVFGFLSDRFARMKVFTVNLVIMLIGSILLSRMIESLFWISMVMFGLGWGGVYTMIQLSVMNIFGTRDAGKILGTITVLDAAGGGLGIWLTGLFFDKYQSYGFSYTVFAVFVFISLLCLTQVKPLKESNYA